MLIISYDIQDDKLRTRFSKFIKKYGERMQYSVFRVDNSKRILENIRAEVTNRFEREFSQTDSVLIFDVSEERKLIRWGYAKNDESGLIVVS